MANSDKRTLLARRKRELDHAIEHGFDELKIAHRADKVRSAVLAVLKKYRNPLTQQVESEIAPEWKVLEGKWATMPTADIIDAARHWPERPTLRDLGA